MGNRAPHIKTSEKERIRPIFEEIFSYDGEVNRCEKSKEV
jgi:hypothetical protein